MSLTGPRQPFLDSRETAQRLLRRGYRRHQQALARSAADPGRIKATFVRKL